MNDRQILVNKISYNGGRDLLEKLSESCYIDVLTGEFYCRKCDNAVHIDLSRHYAFCPVHGMLV